MKAFLTVLLMAHVVVAAPVKRATRTGLHVGYDATHLDLDKRVLQFTLTQPAASAAITAIAEDGSEIGKGNATYNADRPGTWLTISWTQPAGTRVLKLLLHAESTQGANVDLELIPWSVTVDHEDVNFATNRAIIEDNEQGKLDASVVAITDIVKRSEKFVKMQLFIAGHTDTVGPSAQNRKLSLDRARAIGRYLRNHGVALPILVAGFGEDVPKVKTPDNTDARVNRRADYVIGPLGAPPPFAGPYLKARAAWTAKL